MGDVSLGQLKNAVIYIGVAQKAPLSRVAGKVEAFNSALGANIYGVLKLPVVHPKLAEWIRDEISVAVCEQSQNAILQASQP